MLQRLKGSLHAKIIVAVVAVLTITLGSSYFIEAREHEKEFREKLQIEIENIGTVLVSVIHDIMLRDDKAALDRMIGEIGKVDVVKRVYVLKPDGNIIATSGKGMRGVPDEDALKRAINEDRAAFEFKRTGAGEPYMVGLIPVRAEQACLGCHSSINVGRPIGFLGLERWAGSDYEKLQAVMLRHVLLGLGTIGFACFVLAWSLRRLVTKPVLMLRRSSERIGDGELEHRICLNTGDEIEELADEFNRMAVKLADSHAALERQVAERTESLAEEMLSRERAEKALLQSEEKFGSLVESTSDWIWELDRDGVFIYSSSKVTEILGYELEHVLGKTPLDFMYPNEARRVATDFLQIILHQESDSAGQDADAPDGGLETLLESGGSKTIGQRESAPDNGKDDRNPRGEELSEPPFSSLQSRIDIALGIDGDARKRRFSVKLVAERGFIKDYEIIFKTKDGEEMIGFATVGGIRGANGEALGYRGIIKDVTEQKKLEGQFLQAQKMESIGTLAGGIAHDFNNILGGILGYASLIKMKLSEEDPFFSKIETIEKSALRAAELTAQLLGFARGGKYEAKQINLNDIADETLKIISRTFDKSIEIETSFRKQLPTVEGDAGQLEQVLMNLCVNARDAMDGGGKLIIETGVETPTEEYMRTHWDAKPGLYATLSVSDTGVGIDKNVLRKIFEPFFTTKEKGRGTGLGLSMVYGVVKNHDGYVSVYSELCVGTTFKVYLPVSGKPESEENPEVEAPRGGSELILVVDDEEALRSLAREMLEAFGYRVLLAQNGEEAVKIYAEHGNEIDLAILDMVMPKMGGRETFLKLKELNPKVKALLSTGYSRDGRAQAILRSGVKGFIQKPYQVYELLAEVRKVLDAKASV